MTQLTLYVDSHFISPYALTAFVALEEKGLPYALETVSLPQGGQHAPGYGARTARVPSLRHGDFWLAESQAIAEYLAETFPAPGYPRLFPADLQQRAICREVMAWVRSDLMPIREERSTYSVWYERSERPLSDAGQAAARRLVAYAERLVAPGRTTLFDAWCIADVDLAMMLMRLHANRDALPAALIAYVEANFARPSVHKWSARTRPTYVAY